ncbi:hypothetical protein DFH06DRAFT_1312703 [Mycena polygramma]|nr:hypothetical protein DFH06DRAFT_1312703 [Mycena polygramma]
MQTDCISSFSTQTTSASVAPLSIMASPKASHALLPLLPTDLEREIFETAALDYPRSIPRLVLVAQRVNLWIEPMLYRTLSVVNSPPRLHLLRTLRITADACLHSKPASFLRSHVRHLALSAVPTDKALSILSICGETTSLAIFQTPDLTYLPLLAAMPLLRLAAHLANIFGSEAAVDFRHTIFSRLTHLDMFDSVWDTNHLVRGLASLPCLTHLSFNQDLEDLIGDDRLPSLRDILRSCGSLQVLVVIFYDETERGWGDEDEYEYFADDVRAVTMVVGGSLEDWERGQTGRVDYWIQAETFIQKRRSGEIKASEYAIPVELGSSDFASENSLPNENDSDGAHSA